MIVLYRVTTQTIGIHIDQQTLPVEKLNPNLLMRAFSQVKPSIEISVLI